MKTVQTHAQNTPKRLAFWALAVGAILLIPALTRAPWSLGDYIFAGIVLLGAATGYELIAQKTSNQLYRILVAIAALGGVLLVWAWAVA